ncbi:hypothetical protein U9M48_006644 [Paspalum notatum var. saurae]|uniref:Uncharacterized protein n=1 Tax=Paspalum notatum var. saurae TaxID=547442 RepID=A0AAQ3SGD0_PASNO
MASAFVTTASSLGVVAMAGPGWRCGKDAQFKLLLGRAANTLKRCPMPASNVNLEEEKPERSIRATASTVSGVRLLLLLCISWARRQEMVDETPEHWWERTPYTVGCLPLELEASDGNGGEQTGLAELATMMLDGVL